jgi:hypothetical protein
MLDRTRFAAAEPSDVFQAVVQAITACEDDERIVVLNTHEPYVLHVSGYIKNVRSCVARAMKRFKNDFDFHVRPDPVSKMLATITLTPKLNKSYTVKKDLSGSAVFTDGPYKGRQVAWSRRVKNDVADKTEFSVKPDIWNGTFYGWVAA